MVVLDHADVAQQNHGTLTKQIYTRKTSCPTLEMIMYELSNSPEVIRPILKRTSFPSRKKSISFSPIIEEVALFSKTTPTVSVTDLERIHVKDSGDLDLLSISSSLIVPQCWIIKSHNVNCSAIGNLNVVLDNISMLDGSILCISILVKNLDFQKSVFVRHSSNGWLSFADSYASFEACVTLPQDGYTGLDRFVLLLNMREHIPNDIIAHIEFALCFQVLEQEFWDNNGTHNYKIEATKVKHPSMITKSRPRNEIPSSVVSYIDTCTYPKSSIVSLIE